MKSLLSLCVALAAITSLFGSPAATQQWVREYLSTNAATIATTASIVVSNNTHIGTAGTGDNQISVIVEEFCDAALMVTNTVSPTTNGTLFVWDGGRNYIGHGGTIVAQTNCLTFLGTDSFRTNGMERFQGKFDVISVVIQPTMSYSITNGLTASWGGVDRGWFDMAVDMIFPSAFAKVPGTAEEWYTPVDDNWESYAKYSSEIPLFLYDAKTKTAKLKKVEVENGTVSTDSFKKAISDIEGITVQTAMTAAYSALLGVTTLDKEFARQAQSIATLGENLNSIFRNNSAVFKEGADDTGGRSGSIGLVQEGNTVKWVVTGASPKYSVSEKSFGGASSYVLCKDDVEVKNSSVWRKFELDALSLAETDKGGRKYVELKSFDTCPSSAYDDLATALTKPDGSIFNDYKIIARGSGKTIEYISVGKLREGNVKVDGKSIVTNNSNQLTVYGFAEATASSSDPAIPVKMNADGILNWISLSDVTDGNSVEVNDNGEISIYGISSLVGGEIPFHDANGGIEWTEDSVNMDGAILSSSSGIPTWEWTEASNKFYGTDAEGNLGWQNYLAPGVVNLDNVSISSNSQNRVSISGWENGAAYSGATMTQMLTNDRITDRNKHLILCRYAEGGESARTEVHYVPMGEVMPKAAPPDGVTIATNSEVVAYSGKLHIAGSDSEENRGKFLKLSESGTVEWAGSVGMTKLDIEDTEGSTFSVTNKIIFSSGNIRIIGTGTGNGNVKITMGAYFR